MRKLFKIFVATLVIGFTSCSSDDNSIKEEMKTEADFQYEIEYIGAEGIDLSNWNESIGFQFNGSNAKLINEGGYEMVDKKENVFLYKREGFPQNQQINITKAKTTSLTLTVNAEEEQKQGKEITVKVTLKQDNKIVQVLQEKLSYTTYISLTLAESVLK